MLFLEQTKLPTTWWGDHANTKPTTHCPCVKNYFQVIWKIPTMCQTLPRTSLERLRREKAWKNL